MSRRNGVIKKNPKDLGNELIIKKHLNAEKNLIKELKERKKAYNKFLSQINDYISYACEQAKNIDDDELRLKYLEIIEEEESLRDKLIEYLKKNDELIGLVKKSNGEL